MSKNSMVPVFPVGEFLASGEPLDPAPDVSGFSVWIDLKVLIAKIPFAKLRLLRCAKRNDLSADNNPGAKMLAIKVLFRKSDGRLLGARVLGEDGAPKRIDPFAMAIQLGRPPSGPTTTPTSEMVPH